MIIKFYLFAFKCAHVEKLKSFLNDLSEGFSKGLSPEYTG